MTRTPTPVIVFAGGNPMRILSQIIVNVGKLAALGVLFMLVCANDHPYMSAAFFFVFLSVFAWYYKEKPEKR